MCDCVAVTCLSAHSTVEGIISTNIPVTVATDDLPPYELFVAVDWIHRCGGINHAFGLVINLLGGIDKDVEWEMLGTVQKRVQEGSRNSLSQWLQFY